MRHLNLDRRGSTMRGGGTDRSHLWGEPTFPVSGLPIVTSLTVSLVPFCTVGWVRVGLGVGKDVLGDPGAYGGL